MSISPVTHITNQTATAQSVGLTTGAEQEMGKEEFLKLLVAQLQHQDPLEPQDNSAFVAELAQFSNLEQTIAINDNLEALSIQQQGTQNSQIVAMVGKTVSVRGSMVTANGSGQPVPLAFNLDDEAHEVSVTIRDLNGKDIRTVEVGERGAGMVNMMWDGRNAQGIVAPAGTYTVSVSAKTEAGGTVSSSQETTGTVEAVAFDKGYPVLQLSNGVSVPVSDLLSVQR